MPSYVLDPHQGSVDPTSSVTSCVYLLLVATQPETKRFAQRLSRIESMRRMIFLIQPGCFGGCALCVLQDLRIECVHLLIHVTSCFPLLVAAHSLTSNLI